MIRKIMLIGSALLLIGVMFFSSNALAAAKPQTVKLPAHKSFALVSSAFKSNSAIPDKYAYSDMSIPLQWINPPTGTKSYALLMYDLHPVAHNWVHWAVINIPNNVMQIGEGASGKTMPRGSIELINTFGSSGYGGPEPPAGTGIHKYKITIYALNTTKVNLTGKTTVTGFNKAIKGKVIGSADLIGTYITK